MPSPITSLRNRRVKDAVQLRHSRGRHQQNRIIVDGLRELTRAVEAGIEIAEAFVCPPLGRADVAQALLSRLKDQGVPLWEVSPAVMEKLAYGHRREGIVAVARAQRTSLSQLQLPPKPLLVVLECVEKPGNVGAVIRTADGAGADAVVICDGGTDLYNPNAIRASLGTIFSLPVATATTSEAIDWAQRQVERICVARVDAAIPYTQFDFTAAVAIVLGSEASGLSAAWQGPRVTEIRVPMHGAADSLNVSSAAAVLLYEARRQRDLGHFGHLGEPGV